MPLVQTPKTESRPSRVRGRAEALLERKGLEDNSALRSNPDGFVRFLRNGTIEEESGAGTTTLVPEESFRQAFLLGWSFRS